MANLFFPSISMVTACIVLLYISYAIPVVCLLIRGRNNIRPGPFWMGPIGLFSNIVLLAWTAFTLIMYSFPSVRPVLPGSKFCSYFPPSEWSRRHEGSVWREEEIFSFEIKQLLTERC